MVGSVKGPWAYVGELVELHKVTDPVERRSTWRQSMATLGRFGAEDGPSPLEALNPDALARGVQAALAAGLVDDLDWLAAPAAGVALYALAAALPVGTEQRELGRRVVSRLHGGNAETFVAMATRMALSGGKGLGSAAVRARVGLVSDLPLAAGVRDGALALGLASGRELAREWLGAPSTGSLHSRRFAARLIERAAREVSRRALSGEDHALRVFRSDAVKEAWKRLIEDRESLVWRHIATARGLLAPFMPELEEAVTTGLRPERGATDWRRAATSAGAMIAVRPEQALRLLKQLVQGPVLERDPGTAATISWGLARAAEAEPEATKEALLLVARRAPVEVGESLAELRAELVGFDNPVPELMHAAAELSRRALGDAKSDDDAERALRAELATELSSVPEGTLRQRVASALSAYAHSGAKAAHAASRDVIERIDEALRELDELGPGGEGASARRTGTTRLRDLDLAILERGTLDLLLRLGTPTKGAADDTKTLTDSLDGLRERVGLFILAAEKTATGADQHPTLRFRRLRTLVHLVDGEVGADDRDASHRRRWANVASSLLESASQGPPPAFRRTLIAALARSLDALVRADLLDPADVVLLAATHFDQKGDFEMLEEASMDVDLVQALHRYGEFLGYRAKTASMPPDSMLPSLRTPPPEVMKLRIGLEALDALGRDLAIPTSRGEALRTALVRVGAALTALLRAPTLKAVASGDSDVVSSLELALGSITQLVLGARGRLDPERSSVPPTSAVEGPSLAVAAARVVSGAEEANRLRAEGITDWLRSLESVMPKAILELVSGVAGKLAEVPVDRPSQEMKAVRVTQEAALPAWIPPRRTLGGFYILRALGAGGTGSVFVANRVEDRHDESAERFALKVPDYSPQAARLLSEVEFLALFRSEASALLAIPTHPNVARFVTFDTAARPKPILVMELVEGLTFERVIQARALDMGRALSILDDVLKGLSAMHSAHIGHLDVKPANVVLRGGETGVLVDFGLAGRHVRPGCASGPYGAPEVWTASAEEASALTPMAADVYAFGCLAFEALTGQMLFEAPNDTAQIALHLAHDGFPPRLRDFSAKPGMSGLAELLFWTLRREPANRPRIDRVRDDFRRVALPLLGAKWPLV